MQLIPNILKTVFLILSYAFNFDGNEKRNNSTTYCIFVFKNIKYQM